MGLFTWDGPDLKGAAAFCLLASEVWRRSYGGGRWSWREIGLSAGAPLRTATADFFPIVMKGLMFWRRAEDRFLRRHVAFLTALACEGGLPEPALRRFGKPLGSYLQACAEDCGFGGVWKRHPGQAVFDNLHLLPRELRSQPFLDVAADCLELWRREGCAVPGPSTPGASEPLVGPLDRAGVAVLRAPATPVARGGLTVHTALARTEDYWLVQRHVVVPGAIKASLLVGIVSPEPTSLPLRLEIYGIGGSGSRTPLALAKMEDPGEADPRFALEPIRGSEVVIGGRDALGDIGVELMSDRTRVGGGTMAGGGALSDAPWVFARPDPRESEFQLVARGNVNLDAPEALVVPREGAVARPSEGAELAKVGIVREVGRAVWRLKGEAAFLDLDGSSFVVRTKTDSDGRLDCVPVPTHIYDDSGRPLHLGVPAFLLLDAAGNRVRYVALSDLEWKPNGSRDAWRPMSRPPLGTCSIRYVPGGIELYRGRFNVLPAGFERRVEPSQTGRAGRVILHGLGDAELQGVPVPGAAVSLIREGGGIWRCDVEAGPLPPSTFEVAIDFGDERALRLSLPTPVRSARFIGRDGRPIKSGGRVSLEQLGGVRAQVLAPGQRGDFVVDASLRSKAEDHLVQNALEIDERLEEVYPGCHELDLTRLMSALDLMLTTTTDLDAFFRLHIRATRGEAVKSSRIEVSRYEQGFILEKTAATARLDDTASADPNVDRDGGGNISVLAVPLLAPERGQDSLQPTGPRSWSLQGVCDEPGPWLLAGMEGDYCRVRPTLWFVAPKEGTPAPEVSYPRGFRAAVLIRDPEERRLAFEKLLASLTDGSVAEDDRDYLEGVLEALRNLPPTSHDLFVALSRCPENLPAVLLSLDPARLRRVWDYLERLPLSWHLVPLRAWFHACRGRALALRSGLEGVPGFDGDSIRKTIDEHLGSFFEPLRLKLDSMAVVERFVRRHLAEGAREAGGRFAIPDPVRDPSVDAYRRTILGRLDGQERLPGWGGLPALIASIERQVEPLRVPLFGAEVPVYSRTLLNAPAAAAWVAVAGLRVTTDDVYNIRRLRAFQTSSFDAAYAAHLSAAIAVVLARRPELLS